MTLLIQNYKVSFSIKPAVSAVNGWAETYSKFQPLMMQKRFGFGSLYFEIYLSFVIWDLNSLMLENEEILRQSRFGKPDIGHYTRTSAQDGIFSSCATGWCGPFPGCGPS